MTIEVEAPDGSVVEFPDGTAPDVMKGAMQKRFGVKAPPAPAVNARPNPNVAAVGAQDYDLGSEILNGMTFGTLPNLQAGVLAGVQGLKNAIGYDGPTVSDTYDRELKAAQDARREYRATHPFIAAAGDIAGGVLTGGGLAKSGATLVGREVSPLVARIFGGSQVVPKLAAGAVEGGGYSAAAGFGGGEGGFDQRVENAEKNIPAGVLFGAGAVPAAALAGHGIGAIANMYRGMTDPAAHGTDMLIRSIMRDKQTPEQLASAVEEARGAGQPDFTAVDAAGRNTQRLFKMATRTPGEFRNDAAHVLDARQGGQVERLQGYVDQATGNTGPKAREIERGIEGAQSKEATAGYERAYAVPAPQGAFYDDMLKRQSVQDALSGVQRMAAENPRLGPLLFDTTVGPNGEQITTPTMRGWDMVKRNLDTQVDSAYRSSDAQTRALAGAIKETRDALRGQLAADNPAYGETLAKYGDASTALNSIQSGRDLVKSPTDDVTKETFAAVPEGQKDLARAGAAAEIKNKLDTKRGGADATMMFDNNATRSVLDQTAVDPTARAVLGNAGTATTRTGQLGREQAMAGTRRLVNGGSDTVENLLEQPPPGIGQAIGLAASGHPVRGAGMGFEVLRRAVSGLREEGAKAIGDALLSNDPAKIRSLADLFANAQQIANQPTTMPAVLAAAFGAPRQRSNSRSASVGR